MRLSVLLALAISTSALAQEPAPEPAAPAPAASLVPVRTTGFVVGTVLDPASVPYPGLTLQVGETPVTTDDEGRFTVELPPGDYLVTVDKPGLFVPGDLVVKVAVGGTTKVDIALTSDDSDAYEVVVYAPEVVGGVNASLDEKRESAAVTEVIGAEQMAKSGDSTATAALARVTGLTVVDGRYVYVRGLGDRYSSTLLNRSSLPSPEPEKRVVPLDLFPTGMLEDVTVYKTWEPDLPGEFGGGLIELKTRGIPDRPYNLASVTLGYEADTTFQQVQTGYRGPTDWLTYGAADRAIPGPLANATANGQLVEGDIFHPEGFTADDLARIGRSVDASRWGLTKTTLPPDFGLRLAFGRRISLGKPQLGVYAGITYRNEWSYDHTTLSDYVAGSDGALNRQFRYTFDQPTNDVVLGGLANVGLKLSDDHALYYTLFLTRSATYQARQYQGYNEEIGGPLRGMRLDWVQRQLLFQQLRGEHTFPAIGDLHAEWRYALSTATRDEPDRRETRYDYEASTDQWLISDRPEGNNVLYSALHDVNHDARVDVDLPFGSDDRPGKIQIGGQYIQRERGTDTRRFHFENKGGGLITDDARALPADQLFSPQNVDPDGYVLLETTTASDSYSAKQLVKAGYAMTDFPFDAVAHSVRGLRDLSVLAGVRVERSYQGVDTYQLFAPVPTDVIANLANTDVLPSVTFTQSLLPPIQDPNDGAMQIRAGWSRTVNRPDFRELSPVNSYEVTGAKPQVGNPELQRALIDHYDLRWEWYPRAGETVSVGFFHLHFTDPIETIVLASASPIASWNNAKAADNDGIEIDFRKTLFGTGLGFLDHIYLSGNSAIIRSRVDLGPQGGVETSSVRALQGQSPWTVNGQLGYDDGDAKTIATVSFNMAGAYITDVGSYGVPDTYQHPVPRLDALIQQGFARDFDLQLRGRNLLDPEVKRTVGHQNVSAGREGWSVLLSLEWAPN